MRGCLSRALCATRLLIVCAACALRVLSRKDGEHHPLVVAFSGTTGGAYGRKACHMSRHSLVACVCSGEDDVCWSDVQGTAEGGQWVH